MEREWGKKGTDADLGISNEGNANREFSLHATREGFGASLSLVLKVQETDYSVHLIWNLVFGVAFQLNLRQTNIVSSYTSYPHLNYQFLIHINVNETASMTESTCTSLVLRMVYFLQFFRGTLEEVLSALEELR